MKKRLIAIFIAMTMVLSMFTFISTFAEETCLVSYTFEEDVEESWGAFSAAGKHLSSYSNDYASEGTRSLHINDNDASLATGITSPLIEITSDMSFVADIDIYLVSGTVNYYVRFFDAEKKQLKSYDKASSTTGEWSLVRIRPAVPSGAAYARVLVATSSAGLGEAYIDNISLTATKTEAPPVFGYFPPTQTEAVDASLVAPVDGKLQYNTYTKEGDKLGDFSYAGYYGGEFNLPDTRKLPRAIELSPSGTGDDTKMIQNAINDAYSKNPDEPINVIKLKAGKYYINKSGLSLKSGIVLSGEGQGPTGTILYAYEPVQHTVVKIYGTAPSYGSLKANILDDYVPVGQKTFSISQSDIANFKVGDLIAITFPASDKWAEVVDMHNITNQNGENTSWGGNNQNVVTERTITAINGNEITIDVAVFVPLIKELSQSYIEKVSDSGRIENVGIENLRIESYYNGVSTDEQHAKVAIDIKNAKNIFVKDVTSKHFYSSLIATGAKAKQVTALNCSSIEPVSKVAGSRRYSFAVTTSAQQVLYTGCYSSRGRHDYETSFEATGPIVFLDSVADKSYGGIETHGTWTTGVLYDNIYSISNDTEASIGFKNHGIYGGNESQGWTAATSVIWNSLAPAIIVHRPPHPYQNFMVGSWGIYNDAAGVYSKQANIERYDGIYKTSSIDKADLNVHFATKDGSPFIGDGYVENEFTPVNPRSLFKAQLSERFTGDINSARPNAPIIENPKYDKVYTDGAVTVDGISQLGASKVTVFIDDVAYDAVISDNNQFSVTVTLDAGVHKIYATQTIDGAESTKTADRFITIGEENGNPEYLQSLYNLSKTSLLINDPRLTYSEYLYPESAEDKEVEKPVLVYETSFEDGLSDWGYQTTTSPNYVTESTDEASDGLKSININDSISNGGPGIKSPKIPVASGGEYTIVADVLGVSGSIKQYCFFYDANQKLISNLSTSVPMNKEWETYTNTVTMPENAVSMEVVFCGEKTKLGNIYIDDVRVYKGIYDPSLEEEEEEEEDNTPDGTLLHNTSFEDGLSDWGYQTPSSADFVSEATDKASDGLKSIRIIDSLNTAGPGVKSPRIPVSQGSTYSVAADIFGVSGSIKIYLRFYNAGGTTLFSATKDTPVGGDWSQLLLIGTAPEGAVESEIIICGAKTTLGEVYVDNVRLYKGIHKLVAPETEYIPPKQVPAVNSQIIAPVDNKLQYNPYSEKGDTLSDFSYGGYYSGEYNLPKTENLPVARVLSPSGTSDDTKMIQDAIDSVYAEASEDPLRVIKLKAGKYYINKDGIQIKSGIILSGEGQGPSGTILYAFANEDNIPIRVYGPAPSMVGTKYNVTSDYVKAGSNKIVLTQYAMKNFNVGDVVTIVHPSTDEWAEGMRMSGITNKDGVDTSWKKGNMDVKFERTITAINGAEMTIDFPTFIPLDKAYSTCYIYKIDESSRAHDVGIENLRLESYYNGDPEDSAHASDAIFFNGAKNCFVRNVTAKHFTKSAVACNRSKQISIVNCSALEPVSPTGSLRYLFAAGVDSQQILFTGCYAYNGRHDLETTGPTTGPIAFVDCIIDNSLNSAETHGNWASGVLFDNIYEVPSSTRGFLAFGNRGNQGTARSQGWTAGNSVMWNTLSHAVIVHKPGLTHQNFAVGTWGIYSDEASNKLKETKINNFREFYRTTDYESAQDFHFATKDGTSFVGDGYKEAEFTPVEPRSIFKAQLSERFTGTILNARPNAPVLIYPRPDKKLDSNRVSVTGVYQQGASRVTVYIDNRPYYAELNESDNSFTLTKSLSEGTHKIYATQVINGVEGCKTADRFITIGEEDGNPDYLQSVYSSYKTNLLIDDPRLTYDKYLYPSLEDEVEELPESLGELLAPVSGIADSENKLEVTNQFGDKQNITGRYILIPSRVETKNGYTINNYDYGVMLSLDGDSYCEFASEKELVNDAYGILFYNLKPATYWLKQYVKYTSEEGETTIVYGNPLEYVLK